MKRYCGETDWSTFIIAESVQKKWEAFINIHEEGMKRCISKVNTKRRYNKDQCNRKCEVALRDEEEGME